LTADLQTLEGFGRKEIFDTALANTGEWLIQSYQQMGYTDIQTDTFEILDQSCYNIIVTKPGTLFPDRYVIIDGHYDTRNGPGVNDNGSGVAIILEIARLIANIPTQYSIRFINFSSEEYGLFGSTHYVQEVVIPQEMDIRIVFNIDEVGGVAGLPNDTVICERDESPPAYNNAESSAFTDTLVNLTELYSDLQTVVSYAYGSDYVPFQTNGEIITGLFEFNNSPYPHTIHDSLVNLDIVYVTEIARASVASALYFACEITTGTIELPVAEDGSYPDIYPVPFNDFINIKIPDEFLSSWVMIYNATGDLMRNWKIAEPGISREETESLVPGPYYFRIAGEDGMVIKTGSLIKAM
jgi:hypothetical protein